MDDKELQTYYEESFNTFTSLGWKFFTEDMENLNKVLDDLGSVDSIENLYYRKGQLDILKLVLSRKNDFENAWTELNA